MRKSTKETNGFVFFSLLDSDNLIECQDPCHCFIPIDEVADPNTLSTFVEVYNDGPEVLEEMPILKPVLPIFEFKDVDICGNCDGRILVASVEAETGIIFFHKENQPISKIEEIFDVDLFEPKEYDTFFFEHKMICQKWEDWRHRKGEEHKPIRDNRKTLLDRKVQRDNRAVLREIKLISIAEEDFYEENFFLISDALEFEQEEEEDFLLGALA